MNIAQLILYGKILGWGAGAAATGIVPPITAQVDINATTDATTLSNFVAFTTQACDSVYVENIFQYPIQFQLGGSGNTFDLPIGAAILIPVNANANEIAVRRTDYASPQTLYPTASQAVGVRGTAITGGEGKRWARPTVVAASVTGQSVTFAAFGSATCDAVELINNTGTGLQVKIGTATLTPRVGYGEAKLYVVSNANQLSFERYGASSSVSFTTPVQGFALTLLSGQQLPSTRKPVLFDWNKAKVIDAEAAIGLDEMTGLPPDSNGALYLGAAVAPNNAAHVKYEKVLADFDLSANLTIVGGTATDIAPASTDDAGLSGSFPNVVLTTGGGVVNIARTAVNAAPIDCRNGSIHVGFQLTAITGLSSFSIDLFDSGSPGAVPANYLTSNASATRSALSILNIQASIGRTLSVPLSTGDGATNTGMFTAVGTGADLSAVKWGRINVAGNAITFRPYKLSFVANTLTKAMCLWEFDDHIAIEKTQAAKRLWKYGWPCTINSSPVVRMADATNLMAVVDLRAIEQQHRGQVSPQDYDANNVWFTADADNWLRRNSKSQLAFKRWGLKGTQHGSYYTAGSGDSVNARMKPVIDKARTIYRDMTTFSTTTDVDPLGVSFPYADPMVLLGYSFVGSGSAYANRQAWAKACIDDAIARRGVIIFRMHGDVLATGTISDDFDAILAYLASLSDRIDCGTRSDLWRLNQRSVDASPNLALNLENMELFGDGSDGDVSLDGTVAAPSWATKSGSVYTLNRDVYPRNLTLTGTAQLVMAATGSSMNKLCVSGVLDISAAAAGAINADGNSYAATTGTGSGAAPVNVTNGSTGIGGIATAGQSGGLSAGTIGASPTAVALAAGGLAGTSGAGGLGSSGAGGALKIATPHTNTGAIHTATSLLAKGLTLFGGGGGGASGGSGGGDGTAGGGSGTGGNGGAVLSITARYINRGASTAAGAIRASGGRGGNGGTPAGGNRGGGGGGAGGGGGWAYVVFGGLIGTTGTGVVAATGGAGGDGGTGLGTGVGGAGGGGGFGGRVTLVNATTGKISELIGVAGTAGVAASGTVAGTGSAGGAAAVDL